MATCDQGNPGIELRILPLGASIVAGVGSSDGNGFRAPLQDALADMKMEFVGTLRSGSMANNYHECHSGFTIRSDNPLGWIFAKPSMKALLTMPTSAKLKILP